MNAFRRTALTLAALHPEDRRAILGALPPDQRLRVEVELKALSSSSSREVGQAVEEFGTHARAPEIARSAVEPTERRIRSCRNLPDGLVGAALLALSPEDRSPLLSKLEVRRRDRIQGVLSKPIASVVARAAWSIVDDADGPTILNGSPTFAEWVGESRLGSPPEGGGRG